MCYYHSAHQDTMYRLGCSTLRRWCKIRKLSNDFLSEFIDLQDGLYNLCIKYIETKKHQSNFNELGKLDKIFNNIILKPIFYLL